MIMQFRCVEHTGSQAYLCFRGTSRKILHSLRHQHQRPLSTMSDMDSLPHESCDYLRYRAMRQTHKSSLSVLMLVRLILRAACRGDQCPGFLEAQFATPCCDPASLLAVQRRK